MICLAIESTAHTFSAGIVTDKRKVLSNIISAYTTPKGGILPAEAADHHAEVCGDVINKALQKAELKMKEIDFIAFSQGPGIGQCLRIGATAAKVLSLKNKIPMVGVNHCIAHLEIGRALTAAKNPVLLYTSGANTQIISFEGGRYRIMGETLDIGVGNMLDSFARHIGIGFPGGPKIEESAKKGKNYVELPYVVKGMDASFGGILTNLKHKYDSGKYGKDDLCYSLQETVFAMLVEVAERALAHCNKDELLLGGGVACNKRFQQMCGIMCRERGAKLFVPEKQFLVDNAAMIAWTGILNFKAGVRTKLSESTIKPYWRSDDVEIVY
ncbi:bifunctional N(6)-L-threonylcarbamoyladenine synthase/serine/threonine protein kinase [Candidatus Woesearchaeota archaeon]|nr:bifunctional N(6)-L-threonylcarbamoyladenine synthase/serine/threonine protein kinase [Candidatus Woesearchaeota archaeon]